MEAKSISLDGYRDISRKLSPFAVSDLFSPSDTELLGAAETAATSSSSSEEAPDLLEAIAGNDKKARKASWIRLLGHVLGYSRKQGESQVEAGRSFCRRYLNSSAAMMKIATGLHKTFENFQDRSDEKADSGKGATLKELGDALKLTGSVLTVLRDDTKLVSAVRSAKVLLEPGNDTKQCNGHSKEERNQRSLVRVLFKILTAGKRGQDRHSVPVKGGMLALVALFEALLRAGPRGEGGNGGSLPCKDTPGSKSETGECDAWNPSNRYEAERNLVTEKGIQVLVKGRRCTEWDLKDISAIISERHTPVIFERNEIPPSSIRITTFATLPEPVKNDLEIMRLAVEENEKRIGVRAQTSDPMPVGDWICREASDLFEATVDTILLVYLRSFATQSAPGSTNDAVVIRDIVVATHTATRMMLLLVSLLKRCATRATRAAAGHIVAMAQKRNLMLILMRLLATRYSVSSIVKTNTDSNTPKSLRLAIGEFSSHLSSIEDDSSCWIRGVIISTDVLRLLQKLVKRSELHARTMVKLKGVEILVPFLNGISENVLNRYALKLLKCCYKHTAPDWRINHQDLKKRIEQDLRMDMIDLWYVPLEFKKIQQKDGTANGNRRLEAGKPGQGKGNSEVKKGAKAVEFVNEEERWRLIQVACLKRRRDSAFQTVQKEYPTLSREDGITTEEYLKRLFEEIQLPKDFDREADRWLKDYVNSLAFT